jgi:CHAT domain-containing protein/tetratricopeptide (TPR) repeat protein
VGAISTVNLHATIASASSNHQVGSIVRAGGLGLYSREFHSPGLNLTAKQSEFNSPNPQLLAPNLSDQIQQGKELYQAGQFSEAVTVWQKTAAMFKAQGDVLNQALTLSYLASAFEQLGQWTQATKAITQSLQLLANNKQQTSDALLILAQVLNTQGNLQLTQGQESDALATWQRAEVSYQKAGDPVGILGSQINQARALQALGLYKRAVGILEQVEQTLQKQPDSALKVAGLRNLGNTLRLIGDLDRTRIVLQQSLAIAQRLRQESPSSSEESASDISGILMSLGNTARAQGQTDTALNFYRQAAEIAPSPITKIQAQVIQLNLLIQAERWAEAQPLWTQIQPQLAQLPPSRLAVYTQIDVAQSLMKIGRKGAGGESEFILASARLLGNAVQQARRLNDTRAESYALGTLGTFYEQTRQWDNAQQLTQQALNLAQTINAPDIAYQWQWHLGRVLKAQGDIDDSKPEAVASSRKREAAVSEAMRASAIAAYTEAVNTLRDLRKDLVAINTDVQFSFRESVEPVYRELVELLLQSPQGSEPSQQNLKQAREVIESLQLAELDNFFREACLTAKPVQVDQINPQTAVIYPIILPNQLAVILALPNQPLSYYETSLPQSEVEGILDQMQQSLRPTSFTQERLPIAKQVYDLLLRSAQDKLAASDITTLVFVLDGSLRNLPMAALYDGEKYLIEKYSIALAPGLQLLQPQPLKRQQLKGLLGGLSEARQGFPALPAVTFEVNQIESEIPARVLLDRTFTSTNLQRQLNSAPFPLIHLATHGRFSSKAEDTFILTWDDRINVKQLDTILRAREQGEVKPIELLVLSACQTATGDRRAALGLAGLAVRSGARSTLATLWSVNDRSTASLMGEFYRELGQPGVTKAQALRSAQLALLKQPQYEHPYYWAPFILLGNWL